MQYKQYIGNILAIYRQYMGNMQAIYAIYRQGGIQIYRQYIGKIFNTQAIQARRDVESSGGAQNIRTQSRCFSYLEVTPIKTFRVFDLHLIYPIIYFISACVSYISKILVLALSSFSSLSPSPSCALSQRHQRSLNDLQKLTNKIVIIIIIIS